MLKDELKSETQYHTLLKIPLDSSIHVIKYLVYIEKTPVLLQTIYFPVCYFKDIDMDQFMTFSFPSIIQNFYGYSLDYAKTSFFPINISSHEAPLLAMMKHDAAHLVKTTVYSNQKPLCYIESIFPGQYTEFEVIL